MDRFAVLTLSLLLITCAIWRSSGEPFSAKACHLPCEYHSNNETLDCENRHCSAMPDTFPSSKIIELRLQNNFITNINKLPDELGDLKRLYLQHNSISDMEEDAFENAAYLEHLNISYNQLVKLQYTHLSDLNNLLTLDLSNNNLTYLEPAIITFTNLKKLQHLSLHNNQLEEIGHEAFTDLENLQTVDLSFNKILQISPRHLDGLTALQSFNLKSNLIATLEDETFQELTNLETLILSHNVISAIKPRAFDYANNIRVLDLSYNALELVPTALNIPNVHVLNLNNNPLIELNQESFGDSLGRSLRNLSVSHCPRLKYVRQGAFRRMLVLENLVMRDNALQEVESGAFNTSNTALHQVDLSDNKLTTLSSDALNWPYLHDLNLSLNPWNCDCHLEWILEKDIYSKHWNKTRCALPPALNGKEIQKVDVKNFTCTAQAVYPKPPSSAFLVVIVATSVVFIIGVAVIVYYNRTSLRRRRGDGKFHYVSLFNAKDPALDGAVTVQYVEDDEKTALTAPTQV